MKSSQKVVQGISNLTVLRINAEKLQITGSKETLGKSAVYFSLWDITVLLFIVFTDTDILISIGGYLGLFIGISLIDIFSMCLNFLKRFGIMGK